jgi:RNA polymerase sigma-54 factor
LEEEDLEPILSVIQRMNPRGLASRNLKECLAIQLEDDKDSLSYRIVTKYFDDFMHKRYDKIKIKLKCQAQNFMMLLKKYPN